MSDKEFYEIGEETPEFNETETIKVTFNIPKEGLRTLNVPKGINYGQLKSWLDSKGINYGKQAKVNDSLINDSFNIMDNMEILSFNKVGGGN